MRIIVKQPAGGYAIWSSVVDNFVAVDLPDRAAIVDWLLQQERQRVEWEVGRRLADIDRGGEEVEVNFADYLAVIRDTHGATDAMYQRFRPR